MHNKIRVLYIYREKRIGGFSIEKIFEYISQNLSKKIEKYRINTLSLNYFFFNFIYVLIKQKQINHLTGDINYLAILLNRKRTILTVHDIGHFEVSLSGIKKKIYSIFWWKLPLNHCTYITTVSSFTKGKLIEQFNINPEKIHVIYNPLWPNIPKPTYRIFNKNCPIILQIGSGKNKNAEKLIEAVIGINCKLIFVSNREIELKSELELNSINYVFHEYVSDEFLYTLYDECDIVFFASTYEGFGIPIIEAQYKEKVVITSNICSMPEVAGKGAHLVNPFDSMDIKNGILKVINKDQYRENLIKEGLKNIEKFNIETISKQYLNLYQKISGNYNF